MNSQVLKTKTLILEMMSPQHPLNYLVKDQVIDFVFVEALDEVLTTFRPIFAYFEQNSGSYFDNFLNIFFRNYFSLILLFTSGHNCRLSWNLWSSACMDGRFELDRFFAKSELCSGSQAIDSVLYHGATLSRGNYKH